MLASYLKKLQFSPFIGVTPRPVIDRFYETNIKDLYIVGDIVSAPAIKIAFWQGYQVGQQLINKMKPTNDPSTYDVCIVGAGPGGIGAALALKDSKLKYIILEKERPFFSIENFPAGKLIFSDPEKFGLPEGFWFHDAPKEDLLERWNRDLTKYNLPIQMPFEVSSIKKEKQIFHISSAQETIKAHKTILAIGKRATPRKLGISGEDSPILRYYLHNAENYADQKSLVIGGGDSAVETALLLSSVSQKVTLVHRGDAILRPSPKNQEKLHQAVRENKLALRLNTEPHRIENKRVYFSKTAHQDDDYDDYDAIFVNIGAEVPKELSEKLGIRIENQLRKSYGAFIAVFAFMTYLFYLFKSGLHKVCSDTLNNQCLSEILVAKRAYFPFNLESAWSYIPSMLQMDLGFRTVDGSFWGTAVYSALITIFGIRAYFKYQSKQQKQRYLSLITFQLLFLFGIPEIIAPLLISASEQGFWYHFFGGDRGWKFYGLSVPWPLNIWGLIDAPSWTKTGSTSVVLSWLAASAFVSFVLIPLYVRKHGERFCSYICGCGGLAETLGDFFRELAPRGKLAKKLEASGRWIFLLAIPVTGLILFDAWNLLSIDVLKNTKAFAEHWYTLMVDFWLASVLGVAVYPFLGNRIWCRYFCPLRAYMEVLSRHFSKIAITSNEKCIRCGECTRYCQMGIQVEQFAYRQEPLHNDNSACIQCGICLEVCPLDVLSIGEKGQPVQLNWQQIMTPPKAYWE